MRTGRAAPDSALHSLAVNAGAAWSLCAELAAAGVLGRFLQVSTRSVFGGRPASEALIDEVTPPQPVGIYGSSKAAAEYGLLALRDEFNLDLAVARITGVFGPWQGPASFIGQAVDDVIAGRPHRTPTGGDDAYELTYVKDTVRGLVQLIEAHRLAHPIYHVASGDRLIALREVAAAIVRADPAAARRLRPRRARWFRRPHATVDRPRCQRVRVRHAVDARRRSSRLSAHRARPASYGAEAAEQPWLPESTRSEAP